MCLRRGLGKSANVSWKQKDISSLHAWTQGEAGPNCRNGQLSRSPSSISQRSTGCSVLVGRLGGVILPEVVQSTHSGVSPSRTPYHASAAQIAPPEVPLTDNSSSSSREAICRIRFSAPAVVAVWLPPPWQANAYKPVGSTIGRLTTEASKTTSDANARENSSRVGRRTISVHASPGWGGCSGWMASDMGLPLPNSDGACLRPTSAHIAHEGCIGAANQR